MNIALIAPNEKKELLLQFCIAYRKILSKHNIVATANIGNSIAKEANLQIELLQSINAGGADQIAARIEYNEIDLVFYFRNTIQRVETHRVGSIYNEFSDNSDSDVIIGMCDKNNIPLATNIATAEVLVMGLDRGDLDWRKYVSRQRK